jgi:protein involved in polysaccharide export with SLBB domain
MRAPITSCIPFSSIMRVSSLLLAASLGALLAPACSTIKSAASSVKSVASHIPMPDFSKMKLPSMKSVAKLIPGMPDNDQVDADDPLVPFNSRNPLQTGHTVRLEVYEGSRDADRVFRGIVMVDAEGNLPLSGAGTARVGGKKLPQAVEAIGAIFRVSAQTSRPVTVHIISVENTPVIGVAGDVQVPEYVPAFKNITIQQAVTVAGGRKLKSTARGVYVSREGAKRYFSSIEIADHDWDLQAGDLITLSPDI